MQGIRYERKVQEHLSNCYGDLYHPSPWFYFETEGRRRWCQPDGLLLDPWAGRITICEVKYQHTSDAWWQLQRLYLPVISAAFPPGLWSVACLEIVKWYDPATVFPEPVALVARPDQCPPAPRLGVHIWRGPG